MQMLKKFKLGFQNLVTSNFPHKWDQAIARAQDADDPDSVIDEQLAATDRRYRSAFMEIPEDQFDEMLSVLEAAFDAERDYTDNLVGNAYKIGRERETMTSYRFRVWLLPNPPMEFESETEVWRDIEVDGSHTLTNFHNAIFDAFERRDTHGYEFLLRDEHGIAIRSYAQPQMYSGDQSWPPMDDEEIDRFLDHAIPEDAPQEATDKFRDLRKNPPQEGNAAETSIDDLDLDQSQSLFYEFDFGDGWEHHIEPQEIQEESLDGEPVVVDEHGDIPAQYPGRDE